MNSQSKKQEISSHKEAVVKTVKHRLRTTKNAIIRIPDSEYKVRLMCLKK